MKTTFTLLISLFFLFGISKSEAQNPKINDVNLTHSAGRLLGVGATPLENEIKPVNISIVDLSKLMGDYNAAFSKNKSSLENLLQRLSKLEDDNKNNVRKIEDLTKDLKSKENDIRDLTKDLKSKESDIRDLSKELNSKSREISDMSKILDVKKREFEDVSKRLEKIEKGK